MTQLGFTDILTIEVLRRVLCVKKYEMTDFNFNIDNRQPRKQINKMEEDEEVAKEDDIENEEKDDVEEENEVKEAETVAHKGDEAKRKHVDNNKNKRVKRRNLPKNGKADESGSEEDEPFRGNSSTAIYSAKAINQQPGHTGYLTFATLLHKDYIRK